MANQKGTSFAWKKILIFKNMKRNVEIIFAGIFGTAAVLGVLVARKYLRNRVYNSDYSDHHLLFGNSKRSPYAAADDGVELDAFL
ncbi:hypothetical protein IO89_03910 [Epilithonimonas lactis]|uniref:Uncharacterized protein n=2 Tax=Epilithonimonas lactis TaxID=421072 RepID=A0A085BMM7_9FLAO|nr:hypothetical protein IO89_03910 [Epilithonimonas lactis]